MDCGAGRKTEKDYSAEKSSHVGGLFLGRLQPTQPACDKHDEMVVRRLEIS
jgi:hypothetical protein